MGKMGEEVYSDYGPVDINIRTGFYHAIVEFGLLSEEYEWDREKHEAALSFFESSCELICNAIEQIGASLPLGEEILRHIIDVRVRNNETLTLKYNQLNEGRVFAGFDLYGFINKFSNSYKPEGAEVLDGSSWFDMIISLHKFNKNNDEDAVDIQLMKALFVITQYSEASESVKNTRYFNFLKMIK